jgi:membrane-associated phospholipid phosphatase
MNRSLSACALALGLGLACSAQQEASISLDPLYDSVAMGSGLCAALGAELLPGAENESYAKQDASGIPALDAIALFPYDGGMSKASTVATGAALLWPALFALAGGKDELLPAAACYAEALAWTFAAKDCAKRLFPKWRPYAYRAGELSGDLLAEARESFPSGHAALAFCAATSFAVLALELAPGDQATPWLVAGGYALATASSALRVASGEHFPSDVIAGAILGSAVGYAAVALHIRHNNGVSALARGGQACLVPAAGPSLSLTIRL